MSCIINTFEFTSKAFSASLSAQTLRGDGGACGDRHGLLLVTGTTQLQATTRLCDPRTRTSEAGWLAGWISVPTYPSSPGSESRSEAAVPALGGVTPRLGHTAQVGKKWGLAGRLHTEKSGFHGAGQQEKTVPGTSQQCNSTTHTKMRVVGPEDPLRPSPPSAGDPCWAWEQEKAQASSVMLGSDCTASRSRARRGDAGAAPGNPAFPET